MSVVFTMTSMAVALGISAITGTAAVAQLLGPLCRESENENGTPDIEPVRTRFSDKDTLKKTLSEHGFQVEEREDGILTVVTSVGSLRYYQPSGDQPFWVQPFDIRDEKELEAKQRELVEEYMLNVQKSTYILLKRQIDKRDDMELESEEFLEDESILLRINV